MNVLSMIFCFILSCGISFLIIFFSNKFDFLNDLEDKKHAVHSRSVPRIGGLAIVVAFTIFSSHLLNDFIFKIISLSLLMFLVGFAEDLFKKISPLFRFSFMLLISFMVIIVLNLHIHHTGFFKLPFIVSVLLTVIAITGFSNAINIIDGLNGLAAGISIIFLFFLGITYLKHGQNQMAYLCFLLISSISGFLVFNFPKGKIFLGDGGAYFLGFMCAVLSIDLFNRVKDISPWFPLILGAYPVWEVLFSAYRRRKKGKHPFYPDKLHFHTLVYLRKTKSNPKAAFYVLVLSFCFSLAGFFLRRCTWCLTIEYFIFVAVYLSLYRYLIGISSWSGKNG